MSGTFKSVGSDLGTFFNRIGPAGDIGLALAALATGGLLGPELIPAAEGAAAAGEGVAGEALPFASTLTEGAAPIAVPGFTITPPATELGATIGPGLVGTGLGVGEGGGAAASIGDVLSGLGAGAALGITPAIAGGLSPSSVVAGEFGALPGGAGGALPGQAAGGPLSINQVPAFGAGGAPLPTPAPGLGGGGSPNTPGLTGAGGPASTTPPDSTTIQAGTTGPATGLADFGASQAAIPTDVTQGLSLTNPASTNATGGIGNFFSKNAGLLSLLGLGVGGQLASPAISKALGLNQVPGSQDLKTLAQTESAIAAQQEALGTTLEQPLVTGVLPPGQQQAVTNALNDAIATIKGRYASLGLSGSTMEAQSIADAQNRSVEVAGQLEQQMAQTGQQAVTSATQALNLESSIYDTLLNATIQQDEQLGNAISGFANAVGLGTAIGAAKGR